MVSQYIPIYSNNHCHHGWLNAHFGWWKVQIFILGWWFSFFRFITINRSTAKRWVVFFWGGLPDWLTMVLCKHQKHQEKFGRADPFCMAQLLRVQLSMWIFRASTSNAAASQHSRDIAGEFNIAIRTIITTSLRRHWNDVLCIGDYPKIALFQVSELL